MLSGFDYRQFRFIIRGRICEGSRCSRRCPPAYLSRPLDRLLRVLGYASPDKVLPTWMTSCSFHQVSASLGVPGLRVPVPVNEHGDRDSDEALAGIEQIIMKLDTAPLPGSLCHQSSSQLGCLHHRQVPGEICALVLLARRLQLHRQGRMVFLQLLCLV